MQSENKNKFKVELYSKMISPASETTDPRLKEYSDEAEVNVIENDTNIPQRSAELERILQEIFMADHDAAQLEQYLLESNRQVTFNN